MSTSSSTTITTNQHVHKHTNRLINEKSPYLLQHAHNPVDWRPWNQEAFKEAKEKDKLIFLSIGYSTCHWCHVMEKESFENEEVANIINDLFVNIKVDREERPDIDKLYMTYVQQVFGSGGWPLSVWLTPDLHPITGGTYFAPKAAYGKLGFVDQCNRLNSIWKNNKEVAKSRGASFVEYLNEESPKGDENIAISLDTVKKCKSRILEQFDSEFGGFSDAPKFPRTSIYNLLNNCGDSNDREKLHFTLVKMAFGGIYDQLGGGFHRYSVTEDWKVPHFEKMLYDQAQLVTVYLDAYQHTKKPLFLSIINGTLNFVLKELTDHEGGYYSALDADSFNEVLNEKTEGWYYIWSWNELEMVLNEKEMEVVTFMYGIKPNGNCSIHEDPHKEFVGKNIFQKLFTNEETAKHFDQKINSKEVQELVEGAKIKLLESRSKRVMPHLDNKIITSWNGLMISAFAKAYQVLGTPSYLESAKRSVSFIKSNLYNQSTKRLIRNYCSGGASKVEGFADDYAYLIQGLLDLYESCFDLQYLVWAKELQESMNQLFWDQKDGGYFSVGDMDHSILARQKEEHDGAEPSPQSVASMNLIRLGRMFMVDKYEDMARDVFKSSSLYLEKAPIVMPQMVCSLNASLNPFYTFIILGSLDSNSKHFKLTTELLESIYKFNLPNKCLLFGDVDDEDQIQKITTLTNQSNIQSTNGKVEIHICSENGCLLPITNIDDLNIQLIKL